MINVYYAPAGFEFAMKGKGDFEEIFRFCESDYILTNVLSWLKKSTIVKSRFVELCKKYQKISLVDSGGFQLITEKMEPEDYDPLKIFKVQQELGQIGFMLDYPLMKITDEGMSIVTNSKEIEERIDFTKQNLIDVSSITDRSMWYYFVIHGGRIEHYKRWIEDLYKRDKFDGVTLKTKNLYQLICSFFSSYHLDFTRYHALGTSSIYTVILLFYLVIKSREFGKNIELLTYDSTTPLQHAIYRRALNIMMYTKFFRTFISDSSLTTLGCSCKLCIHLGDNSVKAFMEDSNLLILHNINVVNKFNSFIQGVANDKKIFLELISTHFSKISKIIKIIDLLFITVVEGKKEFYTIYDNLDISIRRYIESLVDLEETNQSSLLDFM